MKYNILTSREPFLFEAGGKLDGVEIVYHTSQRAYKKGEKVVWICHALTGNSDPEDWWSQMVGRGKLIDPEEVFVVCVNMFCSPYGSSCPVSVNPETSSPFYFDFPKTTIRDMVRGCIMVRKSLGIEKIDLLLGPSIGGFLALEWAVCEPNVIDKAAFIATSSRVTPYMTAFNESQRMALEADSSFRKAQAPSGGKKGLECARSIALISYRTFKGYNLTQEEKDIDTLFSLRASSYQQHQGVKLSSRFDAYCYWYLTYALDSHNVGRGRGGVDAALLKIRCSKALVVGIDSDVLFPPEECRKIASAIPCGEYRELSSVFGHDGFLIENDSLVEILRPLISD